MVDYVGYATTTGDSIFLVFQFVFVFLIIALIGWWVWLYFFAYNIKFRVREVLDGNTRIIEDRAREIKDKEGVTKLKLFKRKHTVQLPPKKAYHITDKGKYCLEAYYLHEGEYKYVDDEGLEKTAKKDEKDGKYTFIIDGGCNPDKLSNFQPLDTADREFYASEMREAETYKKKGWDQYIPLIVGIGTPLIVLILVFAFWGDITEPIVKVSSQNAAVSAELKETSILLRDVIQDRQTITNIDKPLKDDSKEFKDG